jgi:hypothetical protein
LLSNYRLYGKAAHYHGKMQQHHHLLVQTPYCQTWGDCPLN